jgi:hypothetical protein
MSINITTTIITRRPTLIRVWRTNGTRLTSSWIPALTLNPKTEEGPSVRYLSHPNDGCSTVPSIPTLAR